MDRNKIKLYNTDKYQAVLPAPDIDELTGDAEEVVISADGNEDSASGETVGSISFNASGGLWYSTGINTSYTTFTSEQNSAATTILQIPINSIDACKMCIRVMNNSDISMFDVSLACNSTAVNIHSTPTATIGTTLAGVTFSSNIQGNFINIICDNAPIGSNIAGYNFSYVK